ncbi:MAG: serine/threonine-protein kinase [Isosphaeraceae bacterium]
MLSSEPPRIPDPADPAILEPRVDLADDGREAERSPTVLRNSGSSARRRQEVGSSSSLIIPIPLPRPGESIDTFLLDEAIGVGGMGAVFRALDTKLDRQVALKLLPPDQAADAEVVQRFYQEGRSAAQLDHENIARVFSIGQDGPFHYIAFEYIEGETIRQRVEARGPMAVAEVVDVALQIAGALVHASRRGVIHRDIKPSNIILTPQGRAKLVDMGLARRFERGGDHGLTQSGMTLGTFDYISPEQARDPRDVDVRSDLYSLGCTMFHMLTGRPPFPGGTVLQKLIQHREESPVDVRTLNPDVPAELSAVIARLMAKERERRFQGPEQLARELLTLAAALGLERPPVAAESWMAPPPHAWWERHLVWLVPAVGFLLIVSVLAWGGRELSGPPTGRRPSLTEASPAAGFGLDLAGQTAAARGDTRESPVPTAATVETAPASPRTISVGPGDDLAAAIASAPARSVIVLSDAGPYRLAGRPWAALSGSTAAGSDLTIRAEAGVHPVIEYVHQPGGDDRRGLAMLRFSGGHVVIDSLEFRLDATEPGESACAIRCVDTELILRRCLFRRPDGGDGGNHDAAALRIGVTPAGAPGGGRPPTVVALRCHFDGGQTAIRADGPADVTVRDCTFGPASPSIWFDDSQPAMAVPGELRLVHSSFLAAAGPVFRIAGHLLRARVDDCVIAPATTAPALLAVVDDPRHLDWFGRGNVYGPIAPYLATIQGAANRTTIENFAAWEQTDDEVRESGSRAVPSPVWGPAEPIRALRRGSSDPSRAFVLDARLAATSSGARYGPLGERLTGLRLAERGTPRPAPAPPSPAPGPKLARADTNRQPASHREPTSPSASREGERHAMQERPMPTVSAEADGAGGMADPMNLPSMPPMPTVGSSDHEDEMAPVATTAPPASTPSNSPGPKIEKPSTTETASTKAVAVSQPPDESRPTLSAEDLVHGPEQFLAMLRGLEGRGGTIRIASGVDLDLPSVAVETTASSPLMIAGEPGRPRPRLRLRPSPMTGESPTEWTGLFNLRAGSLRLSGLDIVVTEPETGTADRQAAVALSPGTTLSIADCTITVPMRRPLATAVVVRPPSPPETDRVAQEPTTPAARATVELRNTLIRSGGDAVTVLGGTRVALSLTNVMAAAEGSLLHALGSARPIAGAGGDAPSAAVTVRIERVVARTRGGLVYLQTSREQPAMATVDIRAANSIVSTVSGDDPLFRLEGQDQIEELRDRLRWEAHNVAYHRIKTYRRDEIVQSGGLPRVYERDDWTRAFQPTDDSPTLVDLKFRHQADATTPSWRLNRDDLSPVSRGLGATIGPEIAKVPNAPGDAS